MLQGPAGEAADIDAIKPIFKLYGKEEALGWHENRDPGTHNYQLDNRLQAYRFFSKNFNLPVIEDEIPSDSEIKSYEQLVVGLPKDNLTILGLARKLASSIARQPIPADQLLGSEPGQPTKGKTKQVVRYRAGQDRAHLGSRQYQEQGI